MALLDTRMNYRRRWAGKILTIMRASAFFTRQGAFVDDASDGEQVRVLLDCAEQLQSFFQAFGISDDARMAPCDLANSFIRFG